MVDFAALPDLERTYNYSRHTWVEVDSSLDKWLPQASLLFELRTVRFDLWKEETCPF